MGEPSSLGNGVGVPGSEQRDSRGRYWSSQAIVDQHLACMVGGDGVKGVFSPSWLEKTEGGQN